MQVASDNVTTLRSAVGWRAPAVATLGAGHEAEVARLLDDDPFVNVTLASRLTASRSLTPAMLGGPMLGVRDRDGALLAAAFNGGNLLPVGGDRQALVQLANAVGDTRRNCTSIVGRADAVAAMWPVLKTAWGPAREIRTEQPLLMIDDLATLPAGDPRVRRIKPEESERYLHAAAAMFTEELGISPLLERNGMAYRRRIGALIAAGHAFGLLDETGKILFKADVGALSRHTCQIQGVWVRPELRGQGIGTSAMASVIRFALELAPSVSLYVNHFNEPARRVYDRLGMRQVATLSTVLF
jgi:hypothetical protein